MAGYPFGAATRIVAADADIPPSLRQHEKTAQAAGIPTIRRNISQALTLPVMEGA